MQRNNQGERCELLSSTQQHASECEGLSALRVFLDWCRRAVGRSDEAGAERGVREPPI